MEQKESSVLFSLKELMNLEEDRIRQEEETKRAQAEATERARADAERRAREEEEARIRAEENRRRTEEARVREEAARLEALRLGEVEKARVEAEQRARMEAMTAQQAHEAQLARIKQDESKKKLRNTIVGISVAAALVIGGGIYGLVRLNTEKEQKEQAAAALREQSEAEQKRLTAQLKEQNDKIEKLLADLTSAKDEAQRAAIQKQLEEAQEAKKKIGTGGPRGGTGAAAPGKPCNCTPGDPLCSCL